MEENTTAPIVLQKKNWYDRWDKGLTLVLAVLIIVFTFSYWMGITFIRIPQENQRFADTICGALFTMSAGIVSYYWGSSASSDKKNNIIQEMTDKQQ